MLLAHLDHTYILPTLRKGGPPFVLGHFLLLSLLVNHLTLLHFLFLPFLLQIGNGEQAGGRRKGRGKNRRGLRLRGLLRGRPFVPPYKEILQVFLRVECHLFLFFLGAVVYSSNSSNYKAWGANTRSLVKLVLRVLYVDNRIPLLLSLFHKLELVYLLLE